jgi:hypothetical protein
MKQNRKLAKVAAIFSEDYRHIQILKIQYAGITYKIKEVQLVNRVLRGNEYVYFIWVNTDSTVFQLGFSTANLEWWVEKMEEGKDY